MKEFSVYRITVDERLSEDLFRLEVCELLEANKLGEFNDEPSSWIELDLHGGEVLARQPLEKGEGLPEGSDEFWSYIYHSLFRKIPWKDLKEGQVYLLGAFEIRQTETKKNYFIRPGASNIEQIDDDVYDQTKILYYKVLGKEVSHG